MEMVNSSNNLVMGFFKMKILTTQGRDQVSFDLAKIRSCTWFDPRPLCEDESFEADF